MRLWSRHRVLQSSLAGTAAALGPWVEQAELRDEARKYWKALSGERPDDAKLKALAAD